MTDNDRKEIQEMIKQAVLTKDEIRSEIIKPLLMVTNAEQEADRKVINQKLDMIIEQTTRHNQRMTKIESKAELSEGKIINLEKSDLLHVEKCPYGDNIRQLEDNQTSQKAIKRWIVLTVGIATGVVGVFWTLFQFVTNT